MSDVDVSDSSASDGEDQAVADDKNSRAGSVGGQPSPLARLHPIGWVAIAIGGAAIVAMLVGTRFLIGNLAWWHWLILVAVVAASAVPSVLHGLRLVIDGVAATSKTVAWILCWIVFVITLFNVVTRYGSRYTDRDIIIGETTSAAWMLFALIFLLGVNYGVRSGVNPRIDFWWAEFSNKRKAWLDFVLHVALLLPFLIMGGRVLLNYVATSLGRKPSGEWPSGWRVWETWEQGTDAGDLDIGPIKAMMLVGFVLWGMQIVSEVIKTGFVMIGRDDLGDLPEQDAPLRVE